LHLYEKKRDISMSNTISNSVKNISKLPSAQALLKSATSNINQPQARDVSTLSGFLGNLATLKSNSQTRTPCVRITAQTFQARELIKQGVLMEGVFSSPSAAAKIAAHEESIVSGAVSKSRLAELYDQMTGEPKAVTQPSYADVSISNDVSKLKAGAKVLLVGAHPDLLVDETIRGKKVSLVDTSAVVIGRYRTSLEKAGYQLNAGTDCYEKDFGDGQEMTSIKLINADVNALLKGDGGAYDFIGDANAATIYGKDKGIIDAYFKNLRDGGTARFSVCDKFDVAQHPGAVDINDLAEHKDKDVTIIGATYSHRLVDGTGKVIQSFTERAFEYENQSAKEKMGRMLQDDSGKQGGLGRLHVRVVKPAGESSPHTSATA
jgi:hypothetical protein